MKIEQRPLAEIKPYEKNPRVNDAAVEAVARSIEEFGFRQPIVVDADGVIVVGHTRWKAAVKLGLDQVPVHVAGELTPEQAKAYRIADNSTSDISSWDLELLPGELAELQALDVDLSLLGFGDDELARLLDPGLTEGLTDPDAIPEPPDEAITQPGDLLVLGDHRLLCGDSGSAKDVDRLLDSAPIHLVNTDPPYNVKVEPRSNNAVAAGDTAFAFGKNHQDFDVARQGAKKATHKKLRPKDRPLQNDFVTDEAFAEMLRAWFGNVARVLVPGRAFYIWGGWTNFRNYPKALTDAGLFWHQMVVWIKHNPVLCRKDMMLDHEWCFYGWAEGAAHKWFGPNNVRDTWEVTKVPSAKMVHLTEKPTELAVRAMQYSSRVGENVLDLFGGSGSTLIAAEQTGRCAYLMELDALYCDVIVQRWEQFTGRKAERICDRSNAPVEAEASEAER